MRSGASRCTGPLVSVRVSRSNSRRHGFISMMRFPNVQVLRGDVIEALAGMPAASFDGCLCDPPYGLEFMGKKWDHGVPSIETWAEVLRVLKPGAPLLAFGGTRTFHRLACAIEDAGFVLTDTLCWLHAMGFPKGHAQLKPAWEPITLAFKPGKRVLNIDAGRIEAKPSKAHDATGLAKTKFFTDGETPVIHKAPHALGRWPANVLLDEESAAQLDKQSGTSSYARHSTKRSSTKEISGTQFAGGYSGQPSVTIGFGDSGGASRFFYCAKASKTERGEGNTHPTVKPLKLIEYLARLILPPERDTPRRLLVPFSGSGSEMLGALAAGWDEVIGIEREAAYVKIAKRRIARAV